MTISPTIIPEYKLGFVPFKDIFASIEVDLLNGLLMYDLLKDNKIDLRKKDTKQLLYHHIIHAICEEIIRIKKKYKIDICITYNSLFTEESEICSYLDCDQFYNQVIKILQNIQSKLYIPIYEVKEDITEDNKEYGEIIDIVKIIINKMARLSTQKISGFSKIEDFTKKYGLTFLNEQYFSLLSTKYLLI